MFGIIVKFDVHDDFRETLVRALIEDGEGSLRDEPKTSRFDILEDAANPNRLFLYEVYDDEAAFEAHTNGPHFKKVMKVFDEMVENQHGSIEEVGRITNLFPPDGAKAWQR